MASIKTIFFDLDGTLIDSESVATQVLQDTFQAWGLQLKLEDAAYITGRTWESAYRYLEKKYTLPISREEAMTEVNTRFRKAMTENFPVVPGAKEAVISLSKNYPLALVSGSFREQILWALSQLKILDRFQLILGSEDYPRGKPAPDGYLKALEILKAQAHETLVFEDSEPGISAAKAAGTWVCAITSTNHFQHPNDHADTKIVDLKGIDAKWVESFAQRINR